MSRGSQVFAPFTLPTHGHRTLQMPIGKRYISLTEATIQTSESSFRILPVRIAAEVARLVIDSLVLNFANRDPGTLAVMAAAVQERLEEIEGGAQPVDG